MSPIDPRAYRDAMGHFATGVAVVTCPGPAGLTTNAVTSVSLDPILLLVAFDRTSRTLEAVRTHRRFAVNFLRAGQEDLAVAFASKRAQDAKFAEITHRVEGGVPVLDDALAWLRCDLQELVEAGDHVLGLGAVQDAWADPAGEALLFFRGRYGATG